MSRDGCQGGRPSGRPYYICPRRPVALDSIPVAGITLAALGRRRSSRPVGYAIGDVGFLFPGSERREDSIGGSPTGSLNPLGGGECRGRENQSPKDYRNELHGGCLLVVLEVTHRLAGLPSYRLLRGRANEGGSHDITPFFGSKSNLE
jgi:hypothetical protein